jgi:DNA-binding LacI/PurR family transcriptional regulator
MRLLKKEKTYNDIIYYIISENLKVHDRIPTERELCEKFSVSRITLRDAVDRLIEEKILRRNGRNGTLVENLPSSKITGSSIQNQIVFVYFPSRQGGFLEHAGTAPEQIYRGIERYVHEKNDILMLQTGDNFIKTKGNLLDNVNGVILGGNITESAFTKISEHNIPAVIVGYPGPLTRYNAISCDHFEAGYIACKKVCDKTQTKKILFLGMQYEGETRLQSGYREILLGIEEFIYEQNNIELFKLTSVDSDCYGTENVSKESDRLNEYIKVNKIDAIVACSNLLEELLLNYYERHCLQKNSQPTTCIVTSETLKDNKNQFNAVLLNIHKVGYFAAQQLYQQITDNCVQPKRIVLPIEY